MRQKQYRAKKTKKTEDDAHGAICQYIRFKYPDVIFTSDGSGLRLPMGLAKRYSALKSERGIPDLLVFEPVGDYHGLFLEIKKADDEKTFSRVTGELLRNEHTLEQAAILDRLKKKGYAAYFAIGSKQGIDLVDDYMNGRL